MFSEGSEPESDQIEEEETEPLEQLWRASESPFESFSDAEGADEDGGWAVQIIGEEVDYSGNVRYEARWENWSRADGSNVTWDNELIHPDDTRTWKRLQTTRRNNLAQESLDINIWTTTDIHNIGTHLRAQAYAEKLQKRKRDPLNLRERMEALLAEKRGEVGDETDREISRSRSLRTPMPSWRQESPRSSSIERLGGFRASTSSGAQSERQLLENLRSTPNSYTSTTARTLSLESTPISHRDGSNVPSSNTRSRTQATVSPVISQRSSASFGSGKRLTPSSSFTSVSTASSARSKSKKKGNEQSVLYSPISESYADLRPMRPLPSRVQRTPSKRSGRDQLEIEWNAVARSCRAATITIVNEIDDEQVPPLPPGFQYVESGYVYSKGMPMPSVEDCLLRCNCKHCSAASICSCQVESGLIDENGEKIFAYTPEGLFAFNVPQGTVVIECNKFCRCDVFTCPNRVAQQPRDVPMEVFKTINRGWGVRSSIDVETGKVLGTHTGLLIQRDTPETHPGDENTYGFDLDGNEDLDGEPVDDGYSFDSRTYGNWGRFINHSCAPNLRVYLVVYDTIPEMKTPYVAVVAMQHIPAGTEFTIDYNPSAARAKAKGKGKGKITVPDGAKPCMCGAGACRGWIR